MIDIVLYDGTRTPKAGEALLLSVRELAKASAQEARLDHLGVDVQRYGTVNMLARRAYYSSRGKVSYPRLVELVDQLPELQRDVRERVVLLEDDLFGYNNNWVFGGATGYNGHGYVVMSTHRIQNDAHLFHVLAHEIGHLYGAPSEGRLNTHELLGTHCTNQNCAMQQKTSVEDSVRYAYQRLQSGAPTYCGQCQNDLKRTFQR